MSNTLIIPVGGKSKRFPNTKPKWMLTHPSGNMMWLEAIKQLNMERIGNVLLVAPKEHVKELGSVFLQQFREFSTGIDFNVVELEHPTNSQSQTVYEAIKQRSLTGPIFVKDSDNAFSMLIDFQHNSIAYCDLHTVNIVNPSSKSYLTLNEKQVVSNVVEKQIISANFCVGGYQFLDAKEFSDCYESIRHLEVPGEEVYVSHVIYKMLLNGHSFVGAKVCGFEDWGTIDDWNRYKKTFCTVFLDIDGVLFENASQFQAPTWGNSKPLTNNLESIKKLRNANPRCTLILTTSRTERFRDVTEQQLKENGLEYDLILFGLPHTRRVLINDFAETNQYPSAIALNLSRDAEDLNQMLKGII